jgi:hypothetical protein
LSTAALTGLFALLFIGLRSIPASECKFLHYEPQVNETTGEEELCSGAPKPFVDVTVAPFPVELEVLSVKEGERGSQTILFALLNPRGDRLLPHELAITHSERIHLLLIDESLDSYHHVHPEAIGDSGLYQFEFIPRTTRYRYFAEFVPQRTRQLAVADGFFDFELPGDAAPLPTAPIEFRLEGDRKQFRVNRDHRLTLKLVHEESGQKLPLEKTMDAYAHLVGFEKTLSGFAHMHPLTVDPAITDEAEMEFIFHPTRRGTFRIWVQIRADGKDLFRPFDFEVI